MVKDAELGLGGSFKPLVGCRQVWEVAPEGPVHEVLRPKAYTGGVPYDQFPDMVLQYLRTELPVDLARRTVCSISYKESDIGFGDVGRMFEVILSETTPDGWNCAKIIEGAWKDGLSSFDAYRHLNELVKGYIEHCLCTPTKTPVKTVREEAIFVGPDLTY